MFWIVGGEGIIHTLAVATGWQFFKVLSVQLEHVKWEGFHFYDNIFPLFLFIVGAVIPYALVSRLERGEPKPAIYRKVFTRFLLLIILGLIYNQGWHQNWAKPFIGSVLGEIAFAYLFASLIVIHTRKLRHIIIWTAAILVAVGLIHFLLPVPGYGRGVFTLRGSANAYIDRTLNPGDIMFYMTPNGTVYTLSHEPMPPDAVPVADAEGILNWFSVTSITLMGVIAGFILRNRSLKPYRKVLIYLATGVGCLLVALALRGWYPIIKMIHTGTFYLLAGGCCFLLLALFYLVVDIWRIQRWAFFFKVIGMNAIALYMGCQLINVNYTSGVLVGGLAMHLGAFGPVLISVVTAGLVWTAGCMLYRKKIFLRV
jgi:predicted acyltransferase